MPTVTIKPIKLDNYDCNDIESMYNISKYFRRGINSKPNLNLIVLFSNNYSDASKNTYDNGWKKDFYIYSGEGKDKNKDQELKRGNKVLADAKSSQKPIHLYIVSSSVEYCYQGEFVVVDYWPEIDKTTGKIVYKFKLKEK